MDVRIFVCVHIFECIIDVYLWGELSCKRYIVVFGANMLSKCLDPASVREIRRDAVRKGEVVEERGRDGGMERNREDGKI